MKDSMGTLRVAVPHLPYRASRRDEIVGLDAFFWGTPSVEARHALLIRPARMLTEEPAEGYRRLWVRTGRSDHQAVLSTIRRGIMGWVRRHYKWKLARLILPVREPLGGWEYEYASQIVEGLGSLEPLEGTYWLNAEFHLREGIVYVGGKKDPVYTWLWDNDQGFRMTVSRLVVGRLRP